MSSETWQRFRESYAIDAETGCWVWMRARLVGYCGGYGQFYIRSRPHLAHRWAYEKLVGPIPEGLELDHLCRNRACVNPCHLEPVTHRENVLRGEAPAAIHARKTHCKNGHELTGDNIYVYSYPRHNITRTRQCKTCARANARRRDRARRALR